MNWFEENKTAASIMGAGIVVSGVLFFLGNSAHSDAKMARGKETASVKKIDTLLSAKVYPLDENQKVLEKNLQDFAADTKKFQNKLLTFRPEELHKISANEFSDEVSTYFTNLKAYFEKKSVKLPDKNKCFFGMELYASSMANDLDTLYLSYNRKALEWMFTLLADSGIESLHNVYRAPNAETLAKKAEVTPEAKPAAKPTRPAKGAVKVAPPVVVTSVYDSLPIEITFTGTEASLQQFITEVTKGDQYFFSVRYLKVLNEQQDPIVISKSILQKIESPASIFPDDEVEAPKEEQPEGAPIGEAKVEGATDGVAETAPEAVEENAPDNAELPLDFGNEAKPEDKEIIKQVVGDEKITVFLQLDLIYFRDEASVVIPRLVEEAPKNLPNK